MATYTVQPGDSLSAIAEANGTTLTEVIRLNPQIANPDMIHPGDEVTISEDTVVTAAIEEVPTAELAADAPAPEAPAIPDALVEAVTDATAPSAPANEPVAAIEEVTVVEGRPAV